jgi:hypothetical protein
VLKNTLPEDDLPSNIDKLSKSQMIKIAKEKNKPHYHLLPKVRQGCMGQPKGMLQVLWETGWVNGSTYKEKAVDRHSRQMTL